MKKLIVKELREHFKVALLGLVVLTVMLFLAIQDSSAQTRRAALSQGYNASDGLQPLLSKPILVQVAFFCAIFGALLGWLQIRAESHPDLWAFLVHRPIARTAILWGKLCSGLLLYAVATGLPLVALVCVVSIPGKVAAPFEWAMALPLAALFLSGMVFYLAGLLTGLRKARWFASRGFGLGLAVAASLGAFAVGEFWQALLIIVPAGVVLALAVWGSFQTGGYYRAQPALGKFALTAASVVSAAVILGLAIGVLFNAILPHAGHSWSQYPLIKDGRVVKITQHRDGEALNATEIVDLQGAPLLDEKTGRNIKLKELQPRYAPSLSVTVDFESRSRIHNRNRAGYADAARFFSSWRVLDKTIWYLTADGRLVAYHGITRRLAGSLEPPGDTGGRPRDDARFIHPEDYSWGYLREYTQPEVLASRRTAYLVDLEKRELKPLFTPANGDVIGGYACGTALASLSDHDVAFILTRRSIQLVNFQGKTILQVPYEPSPPSYPSVSLYWLDPTNTFAIRFQPDYILNKKSGAKLLTRVEWLNADGTIRNAMALPKLPDPERIGLKEQILIPLLPPGVPVYFGDEPDRIWHLLRLGPAILCVLIGWWLGRRNNFELKANVGWGIFHLLFGLPGLLAFLAVQEWPAKEPCPNCKKLRAVDRERCEHCGAGFPPPEKIGTEIFVPLTAS